MLESGGELWLADGITEDGREDEDEEGSVSRKPRRWHTIGK